MQHQGAGATDITLKCVIDLEKKNKKEKEWSELLPATQSHLSTWHNYKSFNSPSVSQIHVFNKLQALPAMCTCILLKMHILLVHPLLNENIKAITAQTQAAQAVWITYVNLSFNHHFSVVWCWCVSTPVWIQTFPLFMVHSHSWNWLWEDTSLPVCKPEHCD